MKPAEVERQLENKFAFAKSDKHKDHRWFELKLPGIPVVTTFFSHSRDEIRPVLESKIARQLKVNSSYLRAMINCIRSCEEYYNHLKAPSS